MRGAGGGAGQGLGRKRGDETCGMEVRVSDKGGGWFAKGTLARGWEDRFGMRGVR